MKPFAVVALVLSNDYCGKVLAVTRKGRPNDWNLPGGKVELHEQPRDALVRELYEETGIVARTFVRCFRAKAGSDLVWAYLVATYTHSPGMREPGVNVDWKDPADLLKASSTFHPFNTLLFNRLSVLLPKERLMDNESFEKHREEHLADLARIARDLDPIIEKTRVLALEASRELIITASPSLYIQSVNLWKQYDAAMLWRTWCVMESIDNFLCAFIAAHHEEQALYAIIRKQCEQAAVDALRTVSVGGHDGKAS